MRQLGPEDFIRMANAQHRCACGRMTQHTYIEIIKSTKELCPACERLSDMCTCITIYRHLNDLCIRVSNYLLFWK